MTTPTKEIQRLDRFLKVTKYGTGWGDLTRIIGTTNQSRYTVRVRYHMRGYKPEELNEQIIQGDSLVIMSPTQINQIQWPGGQLQVPTNDIRIPKRNDKFTPSLNREHNVQDAEGLYMDGVLVKLRVQVRGPQ